MRRMITINTKDLLKIFIKADWRIVRTRGSHFILKHSVNPLVISIPYRSCDVSMPLVKRLMKEAGLISEKIKSAV